MSQEQEDILMNPRDLTRLSGIIYDDDWERVLAFPFNLLSIGPRLSVWWCLSADAAPTDLEYLLTPGRSVAEITHASVAGGS